jgi:UTP-glucose-1-phosphate uridylyltransferase
LPQQNLHVMTLLLMAAGIGSRYGKLKQFDDLGPAGEFLMEFSIFDALKNGFNHIVVITKQENQEFLQKLLSERINSNIKLDVLVQKIEDIPSGIDIPNERTKPWGTAHAVWTARKVIKTPFVIINADDYYGEKAFESAADFIKTQENLSTFALVAYRLEDTLSAFGSVSRGVCTTENNKLKSIKERTKIVKKAGQIIDEESGLELDADASVSMNFWICTPLIFDYTKEYFAQFLADTNNHENKEIYLPFVAQEMMENGHVSVNVMTTKSQWFGVTYYDDKKVAVETLMQLTADGIYPSPLWQKV